MGICLLVGVSMFMMKFLDYVKIMDNSTYDYYNDIEVQN